MVERRSAKYLCIPADTQSRLVASARNVQPVQGLTHGFYKYPARFSPVFVRAVIETFTRAGDLVLDPHVGGGTTLVEAVASGRDAIGIDINELAEFVATVKSRIYSEAELSILKAWAHRVGSAIDIHRPSKQLTQYAEQGYYRHLDHPSRWRLRKGIEQGIASAKRLGTPRLEAFGRCVILRTAQLALDGRNKLTSIEEFRDCLRRVAQEMLLGAREFRTLANKFGHRSVKVLRRSAAGIESDPRLKGSRAPRLVVTSPPYPGVHVLYHRWQVDGRKETPLPFMIADKLDGSGGSYYTMGDRKNPNLDTYFDNIRFTMSSVAALADCDTIIVQMLAFSRPDWQLPRYLKTMEEAGLKECFLPALRNERDGRIWRKVPGRRWYSDQRGETPASHEVVLIHRKAESKLGQTMPPSAVSLARLSTVGR